ncbi:hypothetical protein ACFOWM_00540 [Ferruginibacter yonginensis]|uniref:Uncharacterized protein n=1 Tax=Ferruginibacter yonginensis TaxID=1310416 RepID=A0ABV8QQN4_9BACT
MGAPSQPTSQHIFNASSNLLGICFLILTSLKVLNINSKTVIDEITMLATFLFLCSCTLSFLSIRNKTNNSIVLENIADVIFLVGLLLLFITALLFSFNMIH